MNCRRTRSLLSAYIDREITGYEMLEMREHLGRCTECRSEHESLLTVKRLLSALPDKEPRVEMLWSIDRVVSRNPVEAAFDRFFPIFRLSPAGAPFFGRRFVSAVALSLLGMLFIVSPETQGTHELQSKAFGFAQGISSRPARLARFQAMQYQVMMDPLSGPLKLSDSQISIARQRFQQNIRARSYSWLNSVPVQPQYPSNAMTFQATGVPTLDYSGYSVASR